MREGWGTGKHCAGGKGRLQLPIWLAMQACMPTCCPSPGCHNLAAGVPQVSLTGAADGMIIKINRIDGNDNGAWLDNVRAPGQSIVWSVCGPLCSIRGPNRCHASGHQPDGLTPLLFPHLRPLQP